MKRVLWLVICLAAVPAPVFAQSQGLARGVGEAPGGAPLAGDAPAVAHPDDPAASRSMAFGAGGAECRETVPGGTLLVVAYAIILVILGGYVAFLARKNATLEASLTDLEDEIRKRRSAPPSA